MYMRALIGLAVLIFTLPRTEAQKVAETLTGVPIRLRIRSSAPTPAVNQELKLVVTLLDGQGQPANAKGRVEAEIFVRPPSGAREKFSETINSGASSDTQSYTPRAVGRYTVDVVDKAGRLLADASSFYVFAKTLHRKSGLPPNWWMGADQARWLAAKPPPPITPRSQSRKKATLHVNYDGGPEGVLADGNDAVKISVIYDDGEGGAAPEDVRVWFRHSAGKIDNRPLVVPKGEHLGEARWTSKDAVRAATIEYIAPTQQFELDVPAANTFKFIRHVVRLSPIVSPMISIIDRPEITVHFVDVNGMAVKADRARSVTFSVIQPGVTVSPATHTVAEGGGPVRATITPASLGTAKIQIDSENLVIASTTVDIQVGIGSLIYLSLLGALAGGGLAYVRDRKKLPLKLMGGLAGGFVLAAIVFGVVPLSGAALPTNAVAVIVISLVGGWKGIDVIDWTWAKLSKGVVAPGV